MKRHGKTSYDVFRGRSSDISYFHVFGCPVHIHNHRDHLGKFDEKANDGFFLGYSPVAKAFRMFNMRRQESEETVHATFNEDDEAISQSSTEVTHCPANTEYFPYIHAYENITPSKPPILQEYVISEDPPEFTGTDSHPALNESDQAESSDLLESAEPQNNVIIEPISDVQPSPTISPYAEVILQTSVHQDRWSREKHIEIVNIIGEPLIGITTRSRSRLNAASPLKSFYVNFLFEMEPKKFIEAIEEEGWIISMQEELNQFKRNKSAFLNGKISEEVYVQQPLSTSLSEDLLKKYDLADCASVKCPMLPPNNLGPDESGVSVNETLYQANPKESHLERKSTQELSDTLEGKLVVWSVKKQALWQWSSAKVDSVAAFGCCAQVL
ncbi:retrovirus-related pol polyprotein from transposon TNT 1-94 [Tanacetum coccineum]|uniref:Retrovirus-related pol polyprotein from transposon TNT 1-94 n=1 Tax=Tanacetum coccineum TaxID=301880 RepID=A0ABQ5F3B5_9ASTR